MADSELSMVGWFPDVTSRHAELGSAVHHCSRDAHHSSTPFLPVPLAMMGRVHRLCVDDESLDNDENACRGAHKPYLPPDCPFYVLRDDTEEYQIDWSCEDLSTWTIARVMALRSAPPVAAETETDTESDKTDPSPSGLAGSTLGCLVLDDDPGLSDRDTFDVVSAVDTCEPDSMVIDSTCPTLVAELDENPRASSPSLLSVPTINVEPSPSPLRSTSPDEGVSGSGTARITNGMRAVFQDLVDTRGLYHIFSRSRIALDTHLSRHGVMVSPNVEIADRRKAIIQHLLSGQCFDFAAVRSRFGDGTEPGECSFVANGSSSAKDLSDALLGMIISSTVQEISNANMRFIALAMGFCNESVKSRKALLNSFHVHRAIEATVSDSHIDLGDIDGLKRPALASFAAMHGIDVSGMNVEGMKATLWTHLTNGSCLDQRHHVGCETLVTDEINAAGDGFTNGDGMLQLQICILERVRSRLSKQGLKRVLNARNIPYEKGCSIRSMRKLLKSHISCLKKGKRTPRQMNASCSKTGERTPRQVKAVQTDANDDQSSEAWPSIVPDTLKAKIVRLFKEETSSSTLSEFTCACCSESCLRTINGDRNRFVRSTTDFDVELLRRQSPEPESAMLPAHEAENDSDSMLMDLDTDLDTDLELSDEQLLNTPPMPFEAGYLHPYFLEPKGVLSVDEQHKVAQVQLCKRCDVELKHRVIPRLALANKLHLGSIPDELRDLTTVEEAMIARCRAKSWIVQLQETAVHLPNAQRGLKGHIIIYPQHPENLATVLPPNIDDIITSICVIFVGSSPPTKEWLEQHAKPLMVRKEKVRSALVWLKGHNPLYKDVTIDPSALESLPEDSILPYHIEHQLANKESDSLTSRYDANNTSVPGTPNRPPTVFENVVISDVNVGSASSSELRAAALRHVKEKGGGFLQVPHDPQPANEFCNPDLFPMIYPTLFPYGCGGFEDRSRKRPIGLKNQVKHYFSLADRRFQEHYSFLFTAFNIIQRREALLRTKLRVDSSQFERIAADLADIPFEAVHAVTERVSRGDTVTAANEDECRVLRLMKEVRAVTSTVPGSAQSRVEMRNEIRGLMMTHGMPSFYITINPADVFNPLVKFLAGAEIDIDKLLPDQVPNYWEQSILVARNPIVAARFFNLYMKAFIKTVLGYDPKHSTSIKEGGILGTVKAYYGCVEAQGGGTLHCHMMVWIEGALNPNEIKDRIVKDHDEDFKKRLLDMLDDTISTEIPPDPNPSLMSDFDHFNPCSVRGPNPEDPNYNDKRKKDL